MLKIQIFYKNVLNLIMIKQTFWSEGGQQDK